MGLSQSLAETASDKSMAMRETKAMQEIEMVIARSNFVRNFKEMKKFPLFVEAFNDITDST